MVLIGNALVSLKEDLGSQLRQHGNMIAVTLRQVQKSEQVNVTKKAREGEDLSHEELHIWRGIKVLDSMPTLPDRAAEPHFCPPF